MVLELDRCEIAELAVEPLVVEPVDPAQRGELEFLDGAEWAVVADDEVLTPGGEPYMRRYYLTYNRYRSTRIHHILLSDQDRDMHDHPWDYHTHILHGTYLETTPTGTTEYQTGDTLERKAEDAHKLTLEQPCWTLFATGRIRRKWGFHTPNGWQHWRTYRA